MNSSRRILPLTQLCYRQFSKTAARNADCAEVPARIQKLKQKQKKFQVDDGLPVYLKGGFADKALLQVTTVLTLIAMGMSVDTFCRLAFK